MIPVDWQGLKPASHNFFGFIYLITNTLNGRRYVGKKQYWLSRSPRSKRATNIRSTKWSPEHWKESDWKRYTGSSKELNKDIGINGLHNFTFEIIGHYTTKGDLHYAEIEEQVMQNVLKAKDAEGNRLYYNKSIAAIRFIPPNAYHERRDT